MKKVELLAPAGNYAAFLAAIENGADAVYLGGKLLNARQFAGNFDEVELERALDYAHLRDARILLTMNTLVLDSEMMEALEYVGKAYEMGVDAFIVQDIGLAANLKKAIPKINIHASTQTTTYSVEGVKALEQMGFSRVVLARELALEEIQKICSQTKTEIEVFVHGALCICYSGQCLMSSMIGGRSGNRGKCAQPCRLPYTMQKGNENIKSGYLLSPKDICFIDHLADLINAGVSSLKIEGRMKSPEYVASVVSIYRKYLDMIEQTGCNEEISNEDRHKLLQSFNRGGFSKGYLMGKTGPKMMSLDKPKNWGTYLGVVEAQDKSTNSVKIKLDKGMGNGDGIEIWSKNQFAESPGGIITKIVRNGQLIKRAEPGDTVWVSVVKGHVEKGSKVYKTSDKILLEQAAASFEKGTRKTDITASFTLKYGQAPVLVLEDMLGNKVNASSDQLPQKAINKPLTRERISEQLLKMGSTPFNVVQLTIDMDDDVVIPISELNNIRRNAAELLECKRKISSKNKIDRGNDEIYKSVLHFPGNSRQENKKVKISVMLYDLPENIDLGRIAADIIYIPFISILLERVKNSISQARNEGKEVFAYIPAIIKGKYTELIEKNIEDVELTVDGFLVGSVGVAQKLTDILGSRTKKIMGDYTQNITNSSTLQSLKDLNYSGATISYEVNLSQIDSMYFPSDFNTELGVYGKVPVMTSEYCPVGGSVANSEPKNCKAVCKNGIYHLSDRKNAHFLVKSDCIDCRSTIFNSDVLFAPDLLRQLCNVGLQNIRLSFIDESPQEIYDIVNLHRDLLDNSKSKPGQETLIEKIKTKGYTKGHLQRGI